MDPDQELLEHPMVELQKVAATQRGIHAWQPCSSRSSWRRPNLSPLLRPFVVT